jgi:hypothetical protein
MFVQSSRGVVFDLIWYRTHVCFILSLAFNFIYLKMCDSPYLNRKRTKVVNTSIYIVTSSFPQNHLALLSSNSSIFKSVIFEK